VFFASGVLLVAALTIGANQLFAERVVRRFAVGACLGVFAYHVILFVTTYATAKAENDQRLALLGEAKPGFAAVVPMYDAYERSRWSFGDDFQQHPWLGTYVGGELYDLSRVDLDRRHRDPAPQLVATVTFDPHKPPVAAFAPPPTYRQLQSPQGWATLEQQIADERAYGLTRYTVRAIGVYDDPKHRPILAVDWTPDGYGFVDGRPLDAPGGHFIRIRAETMPARAEAAYMIGCNVINKVKVVIDHDGGDPLIPVDERYCRGPFTAVVCEPTRCWLAGWY
jgi:hypothetical protein